MCAKTVVVCLLMKRVLRLKEESWVLEACGGRGAEVCDCAPVLRQIGGGDR